MRANKHLWNVYSILLLILFGFGINLLLSFLFSDYFEEHAFVGYFVQTSIFILSIYYFIKVRHPQTQWIDIGFRKLNIWKTIGLTITAWLSAMSILAFFVTYFGEIPGLQPQESHLEIFGNTLYEKIGFTFLAIIIAPLVEEVIFRGILLKWSLIYVNPLFTILLNGILFGVLHFEFQSVVALSLIGIILASITYYAHSIIPAILFHFLNNSIAVFIELFLIP